MTYDESGDNEGSSSNYNGFNLKGRMDEIAMRDYRSSEGYVSPEDYERLDKIKAMSETLEEIMFWCWNVRGANGKYKLRKFNSAQNHFVAFTALVRPDFFDGMSYEEIGKKIKISKQRLSIMAKSFQKEFGVKFRRSHNETDKHSAAAKASWQSEARPKTWSKPK